MKYQVRKGKAVIIKESSGETEKKYNKIFSSLGLSNLVDKMEISKNERELTVILKNKSGIVIEKDDLKTLDKNGMTYMKINKDGLVLLKFRLKGD